LVHELGYEQPKTTKELLDIATRHASGEEAVGVAFILGNTDTTTNGGQAAPTKTSVKGARKGARGGKKGQKQLPRRITVVGSNGSGDEEVGNSSEECVAVAERDFKCQTRPPKDHFQKHLKATCLHHSYPVKHKLKDCTMMINFMMLGTFSKGRKPGGDPGEKCGAIPREAKVTAIFD
jgi:hypothetical protein